MFRNILYQQNRITSSDSPNSTN